MGLFKLRLTVDSKNLEQIAEMRSRLSDFSVPFANIIAGWAAGNALKFQAGVGAERSGADVPPARWDPVTEKYYRQKHGPVIRGSRPTFADWLMVRTGNLMRALTSRGGFAEYIDAHRLIFGAPLDSEAAIAALGNRQKRPTIFLGRADRNMIRSELQRYLTLGENYKALMFSSSARRYALTKEAAAMDLAFAGTVA